MSCAVRCVRGGVMANNESSCQLIAGYDLKYTRKFITLVSLTDTLIVGYALRLSHVY